MLSEQTSATQLYKGIVFYAAGQVSAVTQARLRSGGGKKVHYLSSLVTHTVVGKGVDTVEVEEAEELFEVPVVSEEWVRLSSRCGVILPVRGFRVSGDQIFSGVVVKMERLSIVDMERIWAMVTWYGGRVVTGGDDVTHLVSGCHSVDEGQQVCSVTPDWVVDSVKLARGWSRMSRRCTAPRWCWYQVARGTYMPSQHHPNIQHKKTNPLESQWIDISTTLKRLSV